ncbi:hypothetical protein [uncultured Hymenobacter sp.]|uniref:hypothetical protein n=1 Tax=uncultured Hymenobacter sp. TaxID=170016 RepID=UPI0035CA60AA
MEFTFITLSPNDLRNVIREEVERVINRPAPVPSDQLRYLPISNAAQKHGVSRSYLYRLSSKQIVSTRRVGKSIQFDAQELEAHFNKTAKRSQTAIDADLRQQGVFPTLKGKRHV